MSQMGKNVLKEIILRNQSLVTRIPFIPRNYIMETEANYVLVGLRRAGKTYVLYQHIQHLLANGYKKEQMLFINFEDERINTMNVGELHLLLEAYQELFHHQPIIFLDELQNIEGWEHFARRLADEKYRVYISGSNAHMLSRDIASTLGGRYLMKEVYPFTFYEYLQYKKVNLTEHWQYSSERHDIRRLFNDYFYNGGLAECFQLIDKRSYLTALYQKILLSDIIVRNNIRNERGISFLVKRLADSVLQPTSVNRLQNILSGMGQKVSRDKIGDFISFLHDAYLIFAIPNFTDGSLEREGTKKHYFYDNGLLNLFLFQPETKLLENIVAIALYRQYGEQLFYYRRGIEVDFFVANEGIAIQVCYDLKDESTTERELSALVSLNNYIPLSQTRIITIDTEMTVDREGLLVNIIPVWKWLLLQTEA